MTTALRRYQAHTFVARRAGGSHGDGPVVLLLSADPEVRDQTPETHDYLRVLVPPAPRRPPVPAGAYNVAAQLVAREAGVDDHPPLARVHLSKHTVQDHLKSIFTKTAVNSRRALLARVLGT